jgi:glycosyltransferase involved in cell wall biosynthesis
LPSILPEGRYAVVQGLPPRDFAELIGACHVAISTPLTDQRSSTILECLAMGTPVVLSDIPPYRELRREGAPIRLLQAGSGDDLSDVIGQVTIPEAAVRQRLASWAVEHEDRSSLMGRTVDEITQLARADA